MSIIKSGVFLESFLLWPICLRMEKLSEIKPPLKHMREGLDIIPVKTIEEVIEHSFEETLMANFDELALDTLSKL